MKQNITGVSEIWQKRSLTKTQGKNYSGKVGIKIHMIGGFAY